MDMKKYVLAILASVFMFANSANAQVDAGKAEKFVEGITKEGIEDIINANVNQKEKDKRFEKLFNKALDMDFIGQFVLGRYWKTASDAQKKDFIATYRDLNTKTWGRRFDEFKGRSFVFGGTTESNSKNQIFVNSTVDMGQGQEPAKVVWRVKQEGNTFKVIDIVIENVSLAITARNEYSAFIKNNGGSIDALIKDLKNKAKNPDKLQPAGKEGKQSLLHRAVSVFG